MYVRSAALKSMCMLHYSNQVLDMTKYQNLITRNTIPDFSMTHNIIIVFYIYIPTYLVYRYVKLNETYFGVERCVHYPLHNFSLTYYYSVIYCDP